jgi:NADH-quinone oxidoreductase subunit L
MFHLTTHAFFKALLFLGAGSVIHATAGEQDIRKMGGLRKTMPKTFLTFLTASLAIAGIPPLSGFFSKDEILIHVFEANPLWWLLLVAGALLTTFYMSRLVFLVFFNQYRGTSHQGHHLHESPPVMTVPLMILAFLVLTGGALNIPALFGGSEWLRGFLAPVFQESNNLTTHHGSLSHSTEWIIPGVTLAAVVLVVLWARNYFVLNQKGLTPDGERRPALINLLQKKYYIDEIYNRVFIRPVMWLSGSFHQVIETRMIDKAVESTGKVAVRAGNIIRYLQTGNVGFYMFMMVLGIILVLFLNILF